MGRSNFCSQLLKTLAKAPWLIQFLLNEISQNPRKRPLGTARLFPASGLACLINTVVLLYQCAADWGPPDEDEQLFPGAILMANNLIAPPVHY